MRIIVTRPQHDVTTKYLSCWAGEIINFAKKKGIEVCDLAREKANRAEFEGRVKKIKPEAVFLNGHGSDDCVTGHDNGVIVSTDENCGILNDKITYALSCNSGKKMEASNQVMISLLKGNSAKDASERSKNTFKDHYSRLSSSNADQDSLQAAQLLRWDMRNQVCLGDVGAKLL